MDIYWLTISKKYVNERGEKYWQLNPPELWKFGENEDRIKYLTSKCKAKIGDIAIFYQTKIRIVQHLGEVYKIDIEDGYEYVHFKIIKLLEQPIPLKIIRNFKELAYCYRHGVLCLKDKQIKAAEALIELIEIKSEKTIIDKTSNRLLKKKGKKFKANEALIRIIKKRM
ncbi:MAG: hypothetical protein K2N69_06350 [Helicobacter sp.]|nr:hypothetical protein [Helicobacter sp.]